MPRRAAGGKSGTLTNPSLVWESGAEMLTRMARPCPAALPPASELGPGLAQCPGGIPRLAQRRRQQFAGPAPARLCGWPRARAPEERGRGVAEGALARSGLASGRSVSVQGDACGLQRAVQVVTREATPQHRSEKFAEIHRRVALAGAVLEIDTSVQPWLVLRRCGGATFAHFAMRC